MRVIIYDSKGYLLLIGISQCIHSDRSAADVVVSSNGRRRREAGGGGRRLAGGARRPRDTILSGWSPCSKARLAVS